MSRTRKTIPTMRRTDRIRRRARIMSMRESESRFVLREAYGDTYDATLRMTDHDWDYIMAMYLDEGEVD